MCAMGIYHWKNAERTLLSNFTSSCCGVKYCGNQMNFYNCKVKDEKTQNYNITVVLSV